MSPAEMREALEEAWAQLERVRDALRAGHWVAYEQAAPDIGAAFRVLVKIDAAIARLEA